MSAYVADVTAVMVTMRKVSSREIAVDRLREVTKQDRAACGDGRWVEVDALERFVRNEPGWQGVRYRWEPRR